MRTIGLIISAAGLLILFRLVLFPQPELSFPASQSDYYVRDEIAGHLHRPHAERVLNWPEHPLKKIVMKTNNLGFREDADTVVRKASQVRVLMTGDSHTDGVVFNHESVSNRMEQLLNKKSGAVNYEILNGGTGYFGPFNYRQFIRRFDFLSPDAYIVVFYSGNDFMDAVRELEQPRRSLRYRRALRRASGENNGAVAQALNQIYYFQNFPEMQKAALDRSEKFLRDLQAYCREKRIGLEVIFLPTKVDLEWHTDVSRLRNCMRILGINPENLNLNQRMLQELQRRLSRRKIDSWDATAHLRQSQGPHFWNQDYHLNNRGHRVLAEGFLRASRLIYRPDLGTEN
ncbi:MAG: SGNH/GDSL hydrolase family protein [Acidobacteria bacterium]|nr:SGNH/GDSL hydrolase family protein [Acidobacteriota bacterium]